MIPSIKKLLEVREKVGVNEKNHYLFPYTRGSMDHCVRSDCIAAISKAAKLTRPGTFTATTIRHRTTTIHAELEATDSERNLVFKHLGHSKEINATVYRCPAAIEEITTVDRFLKNLDEGKFRGII